MAVETSAQNLQNKGENKMSIKLCCPCDVDGVCPYDAQYFHDCEYWCGADEPEDELEIWEEEVDDVPV